MPSEATPHHVLASRTLHIEGSIDLHGCDCHVFTRPGFTCFILDRMRRHRITLVRPVLSEAEIMLHNVDCARKSIELAGP